MLSAEPDLEVAEHEDVEVIAAIVVRIALDAPCRAPQRSPARARRSRRRLGSLGPLVVGVDFAVAEDARDHPVVAVEAVRLL